MLLFTNACKHENLIDSRKPVDVNNINYSESLKKIAIGLSNSMVEKEVRDFIKGKIAIKFDGDFDFLIKNCLNHTFSDGHTFQSKLNKEFTSNEEF